MARKLHFLSVQGDSDVVVYGLHLEKHLCQGWLRAWISECDIGFEFFLCHLFPLWPWASYLICLCSPVYKMGILINTLCTLNLHCYVDDISIKIIINNKIKIK